MNEQNSSLSVVEHSKLALMFFYPIFQITPPIIEFIALEQAQECLEKLRDGKIKGRAVIKF